MASDDGDDLALALRLADAADQVTMAAFTGEPIAFVAKDDGSPVTETDRAVELLLRDLLAEHRPDDAFVGEETGGSATVGRRWIVDPVDGTRSFAAGGRGWATQLALVDDDRVVVGVTSAPAASARWWGSTTGARMRTRRGERELRVSSATDGLRWSCPAPIELLDGDARHVAERLASLGTLVDAPTHGALLVAEGSVEVCLTVDGWPWDYAAFAGIVTHAGGRFAYLDGSTHLAGSRPALFTSGPEIDRIIGTSRPTVLS